MLRVLVLRLVFPLIAVVTALAGVPPKSPGRPNLADLPIRFEANIGQADSAVEFLAHGQNGSLLLTRTEAWIALRNGGATNDSGLLRLRLPGSNPHPRLEGIDKLPGTAHYLTGNDPAHWRTGASTYARVKYHEVYPGIDLIYYGNGTRLEYDFVLQPGARPQDISLEFAGAEKISLDPSGDLLVHIQGSSVRQHRPVIYQEVNGTRKLLAGNYVLGTGMRVGIQVGDYDPSRALVVDPVLSYAATFGGNGLNEAKSIALDGQGNVYITGRTTAKDFPITHGFQTTFLGAQDAFVIKINTNGAVVYSTYLGGGLVNDLTIASVSSGQGIAVNTDGNAYVTGYTSATNFPTRNALQSTNGSTAFDRYNAFVSELSSDGSALIYSTYLGGKGTDAANGIALDGDGAVVITGYATSTDFPTVHAVQPAYGGNGDAFVSKLSPDGSSLVYSTYLGGGDVENMKQFSSSPGDSGGAIAVDFAGNAYVTGWTFSTDFPVLNALQPRNGTTAPGTFSAAFVTKLDPAGSLAYSTYFGGQLGDFGRAIGVDFNGNAYFAGNNMFGGLPTANAFQPASGGSGGANIGDGFVAALDATGTNLLYSTYLGGSGDDQINGIAVRPEDGSVAVTGFTDSPDFPLLNPVQPSGNQGIFVSAGADGGWTAANAGLGSSVIYSIQIDPANPALLYALTRTGCYKSTDGGGHWTSASTGLTSSASPSASGSTASMLALDPIHAGTLYAGTFGGVFKTTNGGGKWVSSSSGFTSNPSIQTLALDPVTSTTLYAGTGSKGVYKSTDGGAHWTPMNGGLTILNVQALLVDPQNPATVYAGTENFGFNPSLFKSTNGGVNWSVLGGGLAVGAVAALAASPANASTLYAVIANDFNNPVLQVSTNGGLNWSQLLQANGFKMTALAVGGSAGPVAPALSIGRSGNNDALSWPVASTGYKLQSTPTLGPVNWQNVPQSVVTQNGENVVTVPISDMQAYYRLILTGTAPAASPTLYLGTDQISDQGVFRSVDGGKTWYVNGLEGNTVNALVVNPADATTVYAGLMGGRDAIVSALTPSGQLYSSSYFGGSGADQGVGIALNFTDAFIVGVTESSEILAGSNPAGIRESSTKKQGARPLGDPPSGSPKKVAPTPLVSG